MPSPSQRLRSRLAAFSVAAAVSMTSHGCYSYHVYQVGGAGGRELGNQPSTEWRHKTLHALAWGQVRQDLPVDNCQLGNGQRLGIEEVTARTNFGYVLASTVTLGFWVPLKVSWRCAKPPVPTGPLN